VRARKEGRGCRCVRRLRPCVLVISNEASSQAKRWWFLSMDLVLTDAAYKIERGGCSGGALSLGVVKEQRLGEIKVWRI